MNTTQHTSSIENKNRLRQQTHSYKHIRDAYDLRLEDRAVQQSNNLKPSNVVTKIINLFQDEEKRVGFVGKFRITAYTTTPSKMNKIFKHESGNSILLGTGASPHVSGNSILDNNAVKEI